MTKRKSVKRALLSSVMSIILCFTMLLGTTFAWFTDSAVSGSNVIKSGNLDVEVEYTLDGETWNDLDGAADLFQKGLWEPGHTEVVAFKITNNGSLALKYAANMNIIDETVGKTKDDADIVLSDILTVSTLVQQAVNEDGSSNQIGDITLGLAFSSENGVGYENTAAFKAGNVLRNDVELHPGAAHYVIVKVDMDETVGNEANHNGTDIPTIEFGVNLLATQFTSESDTFGNQYDKDAVYPEVAEVVNVDGNDKAAVLAAIDKAEAGDIIRLSENTTIAGSGASDKLTIEKAVTLDLNGYTLTTECGWGGIDLKGGASIINGTINHTGNTAAIKVFQAEKIENLTINVTETDGKTDM